MNVMTVRFYNFNETKMLESKVTILIWYVCELGASDTCVTISEAELNFEP